MSQNTVTPLTRFLLPIDGSMASARAVHFAGCLAAALGDRVAGLTLLHALAGHYLSTHLANIDRRAAHILDSALLKRLRAEHLVSTIGPMLDEAEEELHRISPGPVVARHVTDGDPATEIVRAAGATGASTIVIGRRGLSPAKELLLGSVTASLLHRPHEATVYVVGSRVQAGGACRLPLILLPLDGSAHSLAALEEAAVIGKSAGEGLAGIVVLRVIDLARLDERVERGEKPGADAEKLLARAAGLLAEAGIAPEKIEALAEYGRPGPVIARLASARGFDLILMGRRGRSRAQAFFTGSVSNYILQRCPEPTVGLAGGGAPG